MSRSFRPDIEGLRGVAVGLVVLEHTLSTPRGGFIGVDVFFVISGFLITGLLLAELERTGTISFTAFYARRARRVVPAAVVVLAATVAASCLLFFAPRAARIVLDAVASLFFVQNWHLIAVGTDYLAAGSAVSPLQHFWSLAVEEQFYVVWPVLLATTALFAGRTHQHGGSGHRRPKSSARRRRTLVRPVRLPTIVTAIGIVIVVSVAWAAYRTETTPAAAYFDGFVRFWELGVGALVAVLLPRLQRIPAPARGPIAAAGLAGILVSAFLLEAESAFPWPGALLPVLCTALVLGVGRGDSRAEAALTNRPVRALGRISYSLYLWHFPVLVLGRALGGGGPVGDAVTLAAGLLMAVLTYHVVEFPARHSRWLRRWERAIPAVGSRRRWGTAQVAVVVTTALVVGGSTVLQMRGPQALVDAGSLAAALEATDRSAHAATPGALPSSTSGLIAAIRTAANASSWPALTPTINEATSRSMTAGMQRGGCRFDVGTAHVEPCITGDPAAGRTAVVIGDSIAVSWEPAITGALGPSWRVVTLGFGSCPIANVDIDSPTFATACAADRDRLVDLVDLEQPELVIAASSERGFGALVSGESGTAAVSEWTAGAERTFSRLSAGGARVIALANPPGGAAPAECATRASGPRECVTPLSVEYRGKVAAEGAAAEEVREHGGDVRVIDVRDWFCAEARCPVFAGSVLLRADAWHLTEVAARALVPVLRAALDD